jgi:hypothetical protein
MGKGQPRLDPTCAASASDHPLRDIDGILEPHLLEPALEEGRPIAQSADQAIGFWRVPFVASASCRVNVA